MKISSALKFPPVVNLDVVQSVRTVTAYLIPWVCLFFHILCASQNNILQTETNENWVNQKICTCNSNRGLPSTLIDISAKVDRRVFPMPTVIRCAARLNPWYTDGNHHKVHHKLPSLMNMLYMLNFWTFSFSLYIYIWNQYINITHLNLLIYVYVSVYTNFYNKQK